MLINWKHLASTTGYKSLKAAMEQDVQDANRSRQHGQIPMRDKVEFRRQFVKVIRHAVRYSNLHKVPVHEVLTEWEGNRRQWWMSYPALSKSVQGGTSLEPVGLKGVLRYYKGSRYSANKITTRITYHARTERKNSNKKTRWTSDKKARVKRVAYLNTKYS